MKDVDVMWAARLAAAGFVSIAGCWQFSASPPNPIRFYELNITPVACPKMLTESVDAVAALIAAGKQQPGVQTNEVGLYGMTAGGEVALQVIAARRDVRAAALDSA